MNAYEWDCIQKQFQQFSERLDKAEQELLLLKQSISNSNKLPDKTESLLAEGSFNDAGTMQKWRK